MTQPLTQEQEVLAMARAKPLLSAKDVADRALPTIILSRLVYGGQLQRLSRGVYAIPGFSLSEHCALAEAALQVPRGVICLHSALQIHGLREEASRQVWVAIPQNSPTPRVNRPLLRIVRMSGAALREGIELMTVDGVAVPVFSLAKTVADCFKYRNKIGTHVAVDALRNGWAQHRVTVDELIHYAAINRVSNVIRPYLESIVL